MSVLVYPTDRPAYARLCRLLSLGKKRGGKAQCRLDWSDVVAYSEGLIAVLIPMWPMRHARCIFAGLPRLSATAPIWH